MKTTYEEAEVIAKRIGIYLGRIYVRENARTNKIHAVASNNLGGHKLPGGGRVVHPCQLVVIRGGKTKSSGISSELGYGGQKRTGSSSI